MSGIQTCLTKKSNFSAFCKAPKCGDVHFAKSAAAKERRGGKREDFGGRDRGEREHATLKAEKDDSGNDDFYSLLSVRKQLNQKQQTFEWHFQM